MASEEKKVIEILSTTGDSLIYVKSTESEFVAFYDNLFTKKKGNHFFPNNDDSSSISVEQMDSLEVPFTEEEILRAPNDLKTNKSLEPDPYKAEFFKNLWKTFKEDIKGVFNEIFKSVIVNARLNETYLCFIPMKIDAKKQWEITE